jgi:hypothetical protein
MHLLRRRLNSTRFGGWSAICGAIALCVLALCCSSCQQNDAGAREPLAPGSARVIFTRQANMVGAAVPHYVFDRGTGMTFDSVLTDYGPVNSNSMTIHNSNVVMAPDVIATTPDHPPLNARYIGEIRSGDTVIYDRPAGVLQIIAVTQGGDEGASPEFKLEAGKIYRVSFNYAQMFAAHLFDIQEVR